MSTCLSYQKYSFTFHKAYMHVPWGSINTPRWICIAYQHTTPENIVSFYILLIPLRNNWYRIKPALTFWSINIWYLQISIQELMCSKVFQLREKCGMCHELLLLQYITRNIHTVFVFSYFAGGVAADFTDIFKPDVNFPPNIFKFPHTESILNDVDNIACVFYQGCIIICTRHRYV